MRRFNPKKFVFYETFTNENGKQSGSGFIGVMLGLLSILFFIAIMVAWWLNKVNSLEMFDKTLQMALLATALLGVRKFSSNISTNNKNIAKVETDSESVEEIK